jgi:hypothetical protein
VRPYTDADDFDTCDIALLEESLHQVVCVCCSVNGYFDWKSWKDEVKQHLEAHAKLGDRAPYAKIVRRIEAEMKGDYSWRNR